MRNTDVIKDFLCKRTAFGSNLYSNGKKLVNYGTTIAEWYDNYHLIINETYYSNTTSTIQHRIAKELTPERGIIARYITNVPKDTVDLKYN